MKNLEELETIWNAQVDNFNQFYALGLDEIVEFAQEVERKECAKVCANKVQQGYLSETQQRYNEAYKDCCGAILHRIER